MAASGGERRVDCISREYILDLGLKDRRALVLASSQGLGLGVARAVAAEGARVMLTGRDERKLAQAVNDINAQHPGRAAYVVADMNDTATPSVLEAGVLREFGKLDILVNNTVGPPSGAIAGVAPDALASQFQLMVARVVEITNRFVRDMRDGGWGRILTIGSSGVVQPIAGLGLSNMLRASLAGWSKTLAAEVAAEGVTCNVLLPGRIHTSRVDELDTLAAQRTSSTVEAVAAASRANIPVGRYGRVEEFADLAAFLVSERASYVTGSIIRCDGGMIRSI
jgi:3-oxoacyl-[acyl-carrier protein] reductase